MLSINFDKFEDLNKLTVDYVYQYSLRIMSNTDIIHKLCTYKGMEIGWQWVMQNLL